MSEKRRGLGRGLGALIPTGGGESGRGETPRPVDVFFRDEAAPGTGVLTEERPGGQGPSAGSWRAPSPDAAWPTWPGAASPELDAAHAGASGEASAHPAPPSPAVENATDGGGGDGGALAPVPGARFAEIPLDAIRPNPRQPRTVFDEDDMAELVHSIQEIGVLQPVLVREVPEADAAGSADGVRFELIVGERRWRASRAAGRESVPAIVKETDDDALLRDALLENLHRVQLNPLEEAAAYQQLLDDFGCTQEELAGRIGRSRPQVSNTLRLLKLPPLVARRVAAGVLSAGHARALLGLPDGAAMERLAQRIVAEGLSVRSTEEIVTLGGAEDSPAPTRRARERPHDPQLAELAEELSDRLDTRVRIAVGARRGRMTIEFAGADDLHRILDVLHLRDGADPQG